MGTHSSSLIRSVGSLETRLNIYKMKVFAVIFFAAAVNANAEADAEPGWHGRYGYGHNYGYGHGHQRSHHSVAIKSKCTTTYEAVTREVCHSVPESVCKTETTTNFVTKSEEQCATHSVQECATTFKSVPKEQCTTRNIQECVTSFKTVPEEQCFTKIVPECTTNVRQIPDVLCTVVNEQQCTDQQQCVNDTQTVTEISYKEECVDLVTQHCTETSVRVETSSHLVGHIAGTHVAAEPILVAGTPAVAPILAGVSLAGVSTTPTGALHTDPAIALPVATSNTIVDAAAPSIIAQKEFVKREADADAQFLFGQGPLEALAPRVPIAPLAVAPAPVSVFPNCQAVTERKCHQVPVQVPRTVAIPRCTTVPVCAQLPKQECQTITKQVPETVCNPKPVSVCTTIQTRIPEVNCDSKPVEECTTINRQIPKTDCVNKPVTECTLVPKTVPIEVPVQKCSQVARQVCEEVVEQVPRQYCKQHAAAIHIVKPVSHVAHPTSAAVPVGAGVKALPSGGVYSHAHAPTSYAYSNGKSFSRRDY